MTRETFLRMAGALAVGGSDPLSLVGPASAATRWHVAPNLAFDAICFLNVQSGSPLYAGTFSDGDHAFLTRVDRAGQTALATIVEAFKDAGPWTPTVCSTFSSIGVTTLEDLRRAARDPIALRAAYAKTPYFDEAFWNAFVQLRPVFASLFDELDSAGFPRYWRDHNFEHLRAESIVRQRELASYDVIGTDERLLGRRLDGPRIDIALLTYAKPQAFRLPGQRFCAGVENDTTAIVLMACHELFHPPYDYAHDPPIRAAVDALNKDPFYARYIGTHDPALGYTNVRAMVEEDCVQALEQLAYGTFNIPLPEHLTWAERDGGMHVFAEVLHALLALQGANGVTNTPFRDRFLALTTGEGPLAPGSIEATYRRVIGPPRAWPAA